MKALTVHDLAEAYCRATGKYAMAIYLGHGPDGEIEKAAPYLIGLENELQLLADECAVLIFDTREDMEHHFDLTVGDDGPTRLNPYNGPARVYALTFTPEGRENENT